MEGGSIVMSEVQRMPWYAATLVLIVAAVLWYGFFQQIVFDVPFGSKPASDAEMWVIFILFGICLPLLFLSMKLVIKTQKDNLVIRFFPFHTRVIPYDRIKSVQVQSYRPLSYGGWEIRWNPKLGWAYTMKGTKGVWIELENGDHLFIGSQNPEKLVEHIKRECTFL
jgi:hypothetical protein